MIGELLILTGFLSITFFQIYRIKKIEIFMKKDIVFYFLIAVAIIVILGITVVYGKGLIHYFIGLFGTTICILSIYVYGLTEDGIICYVSGGGSGGSLINFVGQHFKFKDISRIYLNVEADKILLKFVYYGSEKKMKFSRKNEEEIKNILKRKGLI